MSEQTQTNRDFAVQLQRLDSEQHILTRDVLDMRVTLHGLVKEMTGIKRILWVIAGAILSNIDPARLQKLLEIILP